MSRTHRKIPSDNSKATFITVNDGKETLSKIIFQDNRATGLRTEDHRKDRHRVKQLLPIDPEFEARSGKVRKYTDHYGSWRL